MAVGVQLQEAGAVRVEAPREGSPRRAPVVILIGAAVAATTYAGAGIPSYWGDEAASVLSAQRSLPSLMHELSAVDAVHGLYYLLLHGWIRLFGAGEWSTRAPSAIAVGILAAGVVVLGREWFSPRTGVVAGILIAAIPRACALGIETRGYAITAAAAAWLAVLFTRLTRRRAGRTRWVLFGALCGVASWFFLYLLLVPLALCGTALLAPRLLGMHSGPLTAPSGRKPPAPRGDTLWAMIAAVACAGPILVFASAQRHQVAFLAHRGYVSPRGLFVTPWFAQPAVAVPMWMLIVLGALIAVRSADERAWAVAGVAWLTVPALALIAADLLIAPTYNPRYLAVSLGAVALLAARGIVGIAMLARRVGPRSGGAAATVAMVVVLGVCAPAYAHARTAFAKDGGADFRFAAEAVGAHAHTGDAVLFGAGPRPSRAARLAYRLYPDRFAGLQDPQLITPYWRRAGLWDALSSVSAVTPELHARTVWLLETHGASSAADDLHALQRGGYVVQKRMPLHRTTVYELTKGASDHE